MSDYQVQLPLRVERLIQQICSDHSQPPPDVYARRILDSIGEESSVHMLTIISQQRRIRTLTGFIKHMAKYYNPKPSSTSVSSESATSVYLSPQSASVSSESGTNDFIFHSPFPEHLLRSPSSSLETSIAAHGSPSSNMQRTDTPIATHRLPSPCSSSGSSYTPTKKKLIFSTENQESTSIISKQWLILFELEFRKIFLLLNYIGRKKLEHVVTIAEAYKILRMKDYSMEIFESEVWDMYGRFCCVGDESTDRRKYVNWECGKTHHYHCRVWQDGSFSFQGPYLKTTKTLLHRKLGDENVLIVKFEELRGVSTSGNCNALYDKIAKEGILIGQRRYRFFIFKDGERNGKRKSPIKSDVKCYFIRMELIAPCDEKVPYIFSNESMHQARCLFMHLHTTPSLAKYVSRCSLILSQTIRVEVNLDSVHIERIEDIPCQNEQGIKVCNEDGDLLIHTDGTGFISEDLAMKCPAALLNARYIKDRKSEMEDDSLEGKMTDTYVREPPLLMQCRLFYNGCAVKGTLLVNRKLPPNTIQIRPSMVKVEADPTLRNAPSVNSLEVVNISRKPAKSKLSKYLIALLNFGGVPEQFFLDSVADALDDSQRLFSNKRSAVRASMKQSTIDDDSTTEKMIMSGVPLDEPCVRYRLSQLASLERKGLREGKLPISESFFLMGTADPTGLLNSDEVCVILENGQISGKVLVYRYPGLHFGDIHVLNAVYLKEMEDIVGNAKYGIFFSTKGQRSVASEIANGDFDGDLYWVSRNNKLLQSFKESTPWTHMHSSPNVIHRKPSDFSDDELEHGIFELFLNTKNRNISVGVAADNWLANTDRFLTADNSDEKNQFKAKMLNLIDIYYDALDAPKTGKKVWVPNELKADMYPHYMEKDHEYYLSSSVLGQIYDAVQNHKPRTISTREITKLALFEQVQIPDVILQFWKEKFDDYRLEMSDAMSSRNQSETNSANDVINKYKEIMYGAADFKGSTRKIDDIYMDAIALYHVCYDFAKSRGDVSRCNLAWKIAGPALCNFHALKSPERSMHYYLTSVLEELLD